MSAILVHRNSIALVKSDRVRAGFQFDPKVPLVQLPVYATQAEKVVRSRRHPGKLRLAVCIRPGAGNDRGIRGGDSLLASGLPVHAGDQKTSHRGHSCGGLESSTRQSGFVTLVH